MGDERTYHGGIKGGGESLSKKKMSWILHVRSLLKEQQGLNVGKLDACIKV